MLYKTVRGGAGEEAGEGTGEGAGDGTVLLDGRNLVVPISNVTGCF